MATKTFTSNEFTAMSLPQYSPPQDPLFSNPSTNLNIFKREVEDTLFEKNPCERLQNQLAELSAHGHAETPCTTVLANADSSNKKNTNTNNTNTTVKKARKPRKVFSQFAQRELEEDFQRSPYLTAWKRQQLAQKLTLTERQVRVWFQNRRMRIKNDEKNKKKSPSPQGTDGKKPELHRGNPNSPPQAAININVDSLKHITPMDDFKNIHPPMYTILQHPDFPKPGQFPTYTNTSDFVSNPLEHMIPLDPSPKYSSPSNILNEFRDIEPMWSLPKFSSYEALLNDQEGFLMDTYNFNDNGMCIPTAMRNGGNELSHFTSLQNLVYPI